MRLLERIRHTSFWAIDFLKKSPIKKHVNNIATINKNPFTEKNKKQRAQYLSNILNHAATTTSYYNNSIANTLHDFPVIDKNSVIENFEAFTSERFKNVKLIEVSTSGSTGLPFKVLQDKNKKNRNTADTLYFSEKAGFKIGYKLLYLRHWSTTYGKNKWIGWIQNILKIEVLDLNDKYINKLTKVLTKDKSNKGWLGFASAFEELCNSLERQNKEPLKANVNSIIAISETLNDYTKQRMSYYFDAPIVSRYSNMENGIIAQQEKNDSVFKINWASYYVEILDLKKDTPVKSGGLGRIVVTDLFNYGMPILRYDTGDLGVLELCGDTYCFTKIEGRKTDIILNTNGEIVSAFVWSSLNKYKNIRQYQLIQEEEKKYTLNLNTDTKFTKINGVIAECKNVLGNDAEITVNYVDEIPLLASGKRKTTINKYIIIKKS